MFGLGAGELLIIFVFALLFIGPKKLPELARGLGKGLREFQKAKDEIMTQIDTDIDPIIDTSKDPTEIKEKETENVAPTGVTASESDTSETEKTEDQTTQEKPNENG